MQACTRTAAVLSAAVTLALGTVAFGQGAPQHTAMDPQNGPAAQQGEIGGRTVGVRNEAMANMAPNMEADKSINMQLMKFTTMADNAGDQHFALKAGCGNMEEVEFSKVVAEKATDPKVKELAQMMVKEHGMAQDKLKPIGEKLGVMYPTALPSMKQNELNFLAAMSPEKMQKAYLGMMKAAHVMTVSEYTDATKHIMDADLKAYVMEMLPKIRAHTATILKLNEEMGMPLDTNFKAGDMGGMNGM